LYQLGFAGVVHANDYKEMKMQGDTHPNSCSAEQKRILWERVAKAKVSDDYQALKIIKLILCVSNAKENRNALMSLFGKRGCEEVEATGKIRVLNHCTNGNSCYRHYGIR
jgi:hypothetical protein